MWQAALFSLGINPEMLEELQSETYQASTMELPEPQREIGEEEFIVQMQQLLSRSDPIDEILIAFDYFHKDDLEQGENKEISLMKLKKVASEFNIRLTDLELQDMIRLENVLLIYIHT